MWLIEEQKWSEQAHPACFEIFAQTWKYRSSGVGGNRGDAARNGNIIAVCDEMNRPAVLHNDLPNVIRLEYSQFMKSVALGSLP